MGYDFVTAFEALIASNSFISFTQSSSNLQFKLPLPSHHGLKNCLVLFSSLEGKVKAVCSRMVSLPLLRTFTDALVFGNYLFTALHSRIGGMVCWWSFQPPTLPNLTNQQIEERNHDTTRPFVISHNPINIWRLEHEKWGIHTPAFSSIRPKWRHLQVETQMPVPNIKKHRDSIVSAFLVC